jgi:hypothetical protein
MAQTSDDLKLQIERVRLERRRLASSLDASGIALHRALHSDWATRSAPVHWVVLPVAAVVLLAVVIGQLRPIPARRSEVPSTRREVQVARAVSSGPVPTASPAAAAAVPFAVHVRALRVCRVRVAVDGAVLDWRPLREGDEFVARPRLEVVLESTDGGALATTIDGKRVVLGPDGQAIALRIRSDGVLPYDRQ